VIVITDVLTNRRWVWPDSMQANPVYLGQLGPGRFDIRNGSPGVLTVMAADGVVASIPAGVTWNIATNDNDRSYYNYCPDYAVWMRSGRFN
jgi:hypothetical protein